MLNLSDRTSASGNRRSGQAMLEYVVVFVALLAVVSVLALFLYATSQQSNRTRALIAADSP